MGALKCQVGCVQVEAFIKTLYVCVCTRECVCVCERESRQTPAPFGNDDSLWDAGSAADL